VRTRCAATLRAAAEDIAGDLHHGESREGDCFLVARCAEERWADRVEVGGPWTEYLAVRRCRIATVVGGLCQRPAFEAVGSEPDPVL